ncbi:Putative membrane protein [Amycolatopsis japonica]|uniref:Putative membrane protein n=1 Tax=Amycolatopsis japonica TaxID=208439 RepID=A0A075UZR5_9PSEU|nr:hypothetical protein [Amycolatopsis japonica]AIG78473.1 Putative membrane protein [Amycolatopsis japonica]
MTNPTDEPGFLLRMILDKLNVLDGKLDGQSEKLVSHEIRLSAVEKTQEEQKTAKSGAWKQWAAIGVAILAALLNWLLPLITK